MYQTRLLSSNSNHITTTTSHVATTNNNSTSWYHHHQQHNSHQDYKSVIKSLHYDAPNAAAAEVQLPPRPPRRSSSSGSPSSSLMASPETARRPEEILRTQDVSRRLQGLSKDSAQPWASVHPSEHQRASVVHNVVIQRPSDYPDECQRPSVNPRPLLFPSGPQRPAWVPNGDVSRTTSNQRTVMKLFIQGKKSVGRFINVKLNSRSSVEKS